LFEKGERSGINVMNLEHHVAYSFLLRKPKFIKYASTFSIVKYSACSQFLFNVILIKLPKYPGKAGYNRAGTNRTGKTLRNQSECLMMENELSALSL